MKDELRDFAPDDSSRKNATDWLMKVISGKRPISFHLNGSEGSEEEGRAVAVEEMPSGRMPLGRFARDREPVKEESLEPRPWKDEFTAEDLCGAPAVPVIRIMPAAKDEITADDVCWVPEERRLKPQPIAAEYFPAPKLQVVQTPGFDAQHAGAERHEPEFRGAETQGAAALASEPIRVRGNDEITAEDISRDAAPYMVESIWTGMADSGFAGETEERAITAEDICRDWVIQEKEAAAIDTRDGVVLPFSYRVLKSASAAGDGKATAPEMAAAPAEPVASEMAAKTVPAEIAPVEAAVVTPETVVPSATEAVAPTAAEAVSPEIAEGQIEPEPQVDEAAFAHQQAAVEAADDVPMAAPEPMVAEPAADVPAVDRDPREVAAAAGSPAAEPEPDGVEEERAWAEARAAEAEIESALREMEASGEENGAPAAEAPAESAFARQDYWEEASRAGGATRVEAAYEKPVVQEIKPEMKKHLPLPQDLGEIGQPPEGWVSAWKALLRLGSVLPWVAKALPAIESAGLGEQAGGGSISGINGIQEMRQDVSGLRLVQYEIRTTVQDHSMQLKRMDEQLGRVREALEAKASDSSELAESVRSMTKLVRMAGIGLGGLLVVMIVLVTVMLAHGR